MAYIDFRINTGYELSKDKMQTLGDEIMCRVASQKLDTKKPFIKFLGGESGEGKSMTALRITEVTRIEEIELDMEQFLQKQIIYTPFEYPSKFKWILYDKEARKKRSLTFMEARELVKSKLWYTVINQSISDANAMSRTIKPLDFTMVSQNITDIDKDLRRTINFYGICKRPFAHRTRLYFYKVYNTTSIEKSKMMQKKLHGLVATPSFTYNIEISKFIVDLPSKPLRTRFEEIDFEAKGGIMTRKLDTLMRVLEKEMPKLTRIEALIEIVIRDPSLLKWLISRNLKTGRMKVKPQFATLYNLSITELGDFEKNLLKKLREIGVMSEESVESAIDENIKKEEETDARGNAQ